MKQAKKVEKVDKKLEESYHYTTLRTYKRWAQVNTFIPSTVGIKW